MRFVYEYTGGDNKDAESDREVEDAKTGGDTCRLALFPVVQRKFQWIKKCADSRLIYTVIGQLKMTNPLTNDYYNMTDYKVVMPTRLT